MSVNSSNFQSEEWNNLQLSYRYVDVMFICQVNRCMLMELSKVNRVIIHGWKDDIHEKY